MDENQQPTEDVRDVAPVTTEADSGTMRRGPSGSSFVRGMIGGVIGGAAVVALAAGGVVAFSPLVEGLVLGPVLERVEGLEAGDRDRDSRLSALENRERNASDSPQVAERLAQVEERLQADEARAGEASNRAGVDAGELAKLQAEIESLRKAMPPEGTILRLADRAEQAEKAVRQATQQQRSAQAMFLAVSQLKDAIDRGDPYRIELRAVKRFASTENEAALDVLAASAESGVPPRRTLIDDFPAAADAALRAGAAPADGGFWADMKRQAASLISVRRIDGQGSDADAVLTRAGTQVKAGELAKAAAELAHLGGRPADAMAGWIASASRRVAVDRALSELASELVAETAGPAGD